MSVPLTKAVVVGASSGMGQAVARELAKTAAGVALVARRKAELDELAAELKNRHPDLVVTTHAHDVLDFEGTPTLFETIERDLGGLDTLVYTAGYMPKVDPAEYNFAKDQQIIDVNLLGAMSWMNLAAAKFAAARKGTIVGISSVAGERGRAKQPAYCTAKAALSAYLEALRNRLAPAGVNVVTVKPGFVDTPMTAGLKLKGAISAEKAARGIVSAARAGSSKSVFLPIKWALIMFVIRTIPSRIFRRLAFLQ